MPEVNIEPKRCADCKQDFPRDQTHFSANKLTRDGFYSYCRSCQKRQSRERYRRIQSVGSGYDVVPEPLRPPVPVRQLTCLGCRHCELLPETDMASALPMIHCAKVGAKRPLCLAGCPIADARPEKPRYLHSYWMKYGPLGDFRRSATPVLLAWLRVHWATMDRKKLMQVTGRSISCLSSIVRIRGVGGALGINRLAKCGGKARDRGFTPAQRDYVLAEYNSPRWPQPTIYTLKPEEMARRMAQRDALVEHVATMGPGWSWIQIQRHIGKRLSLRKQQAEKIRAGAPRVVNQHLTTTWRRSNTKA